LHRGHHLIVDCYEVPREFCLDDKMMMRTIADAAEEAGVNVIGCMRYHFGHNSPPGFAVVVMLDESHCSAHSYADDGIIALDFFTCGTTDPLEIWTKLRTRMPETIRYNTTCFQRMESSNA